MLEGVIGEYTTYKETHDIIMSLPCVQKLQSKVSMLETQLQSNTHNNGTCHDVNRTQSHKTDNDQTHSSSSDYNEVLKLKLAIDELTKYIQHLESAQAQTQAQAPKQAVESPICLLKEEDLDDKCDILDSENEAVRLEIHENDQSPNDSDSSNNEDEDEGDNTKNEIVSVNIIHADEILDEADAEEEEEEDEEEAADEANEEEEETEAAEEETEEAEEAEETEEANEEEEEPEAEETEAAEEEAAEEEDEEAAEEEEEAASGTVDAEEDEIEVSEIKIKGKTYFTTNSKNGIIYACVNDDVGDEVGVFKNGIALFNSKK